MVIYMPSHYGLPSCLFCPGKSSANSEAVFMSHFDKLVNLPEGFVTIASTKNTAYAGIAHQSKPIFGLFFNILAQPFGFLLTCVPFRNSIASRDLAYKSGHRYTCQLCD